ncbi:MAG: hypothetical protein Q9223_000783 [Gallowayella weberi]
MVSDVICLALLSLHQTLAATTAPQPAIGTSLLNDTDQTNRSRVANDLRFQYTGPASDKEEPECNGTAYGVDLNLASCYDALRQIDNRDLRSVTFAQRGSLPRAQQPLPLRASSSDGQCVIDIVRHPRGPDRDAATFAAISEAAGRVIGKCMLDPHRAVNRGGSVGRIGRDGNLVVIVLDRLAVSTVPEVFGPPGTSGVDVITPSYRNLGTSTCRVRIDNIPRQEPDTTTWFQVWAAAEAANAMCIRTRGREGLALLQRSDREHGVATAATPNDIKKR